MSDRVDNLSLVVDRHKTSGNLFVHQPITMALKLYVDLMSQPARCVYMFLKVTNIPFETCLIKLREGEHFSEEFGRLNPLRKVPVVDDGGHVLTESIAIMKYLARDREVADHWYPTDVKKQSRVDEYLEWQHLNTRIFCAMYFRSKFLEPMMEGRPANEKQVARFKKDMLKCLDQIEKVWLDHGKKAFIAGDEISIADLLAACELEQPGVAGYDVFKLHPIIGEWRERVRSQTGSHYEDAHKVVRLMTKKFGGVLPVENKL